MNLRRLNASTLAGAALVTLAAAGCTDLTTEPKSSVTSANIFNDLNSYRALLAKAYAGLAVTGQRGQFGQPDISAPDEGFTQYVRLRWEMEELPTDQAVIAWGGDQGLTELNTQSWGPNNEFPQMMYYRIFFQVPIANEFLRQTTDAVLASRGVSAALKDTIKTYRAEARFLRALSYWHGIDLFGNIPLLTEADPVGATPPKQATRADIYAYAVSELNDIIGQLPPRGPSTYGRATPEAAHMLLAKLYLNAGVYTGTPNFTGAVTEAQAVINAGYSLPASFRSNFTADNNVSPELIFVAAQDGRSTQTWGGMTFLIHAGCGGSMSAASYGIDYCWGGYRMKQQTYRRFAVGDSRAAFFYTTGQTDSVSDRGDFTKGIAAPKFTNLKANGDTAQAKGMVDTDFPIFRLADAYLIYAEANIRGGGGTAANALTYLNAVRQRAYGNTTANFAALPPVDTILAERGRELMFEAQRRSDLIRFGVFTGGTYVWAWKGGTPGGSPLPPFRDLYPLPANELIANPNLHQNSGY